MSNEDIDQTSKVAEDDTPDTQPECSNTSSNTPPPELETEEFKEDAASGTDEADDDDAEAKRGVKFQHSEDQNDDADNLGECIEYIDITSRASYFVDELIREAEDEIGQVPRLEEEEGSDDIPKSHYLKQGYGFMTWPSKEDFHVAAGAEVIDKYIQSFYFIENWQYCINYLGETSDPCKDYYKYEVKFGIPSEPYPVPQATASAFFIVESSRIKPPHCPIHVYYEMEGNRNQYVPWKQEFREDWLFHIVDAKIKLFKSLTF